MFDNRSIAIPTDENYGFAGSREAIAKIKKMIHRLRDLSDALLIQGEAGTGKEKLARAIHYYSKRKDKPFVKLNGTLFSQSFPTPDALNENFENKWKNLNITRDIFKSARMGTLFIQEIGDIPRRVQAGMLGFVGETKKKQLHGQLKDNRDVRVIASTTRPLDVGIAQENFRKDLYFRLNVFTVKIPPLRNRKEDILPLIDFFITKFCKEFNRSRIPVRPQIKKILNGYSWPGNVRELKNLMNRFVSSGSETLFWDYFALPETLPDENDPMLIMKSFAEDCWFGRRLELKKYLEDNKHLSLKQISCDFNERIEKIMMKKALEITNWNRKRTAVILNISYKSLLNKIKAYKLA